MPDKLTMASSLLSKVKTGRQPGVRARARAGFESERKPDPERKFDPGRGFESERKFGPEREFEPKRKFDLERGFESERKFESERFCESSCRRQVLSRARSGRQLRRD